MLLCATVLCWMQLLVLPLLLRCWSDLLSVAKSLQAFTARGWIPPSQPHKHKTCLLPLGYPWGLRFSFSLGSQRSPVCLLLTCSVVPLCSFPVPEGSCYFPKKKGEVTADHLELGFSNAWHCTGPNFHIMEINKKLWKRLHLPDENTNLIHEGCNNHQLLWKEINL